MIINPNIIEMEYAVRGPIPQRAAELKKHGRNIIFCNIGNPQALGQRPITYYRQVLSLLEDPDSIGRERNLRSLLNKAGLASKALLSDELLNTAEDILKKMETGMGAYTESRGPAFIRQAIARFIDRRDNIDEEGIPSDPDKIFLTNGASEAVKFILEMMIASPKDGIMIPTPQYPLYSATIKKNGGAQVNYYPDEDSDWNLKKSMLEESIKDAKKQGITVKAIVVINPANPTGAILSEKSMREIIEFAKEHEMAIIADEVYQENVYDGKFISFAKIIGKEAVPLFSLHSISKGFYGECGQRGGYLELRNPPGIKDHACKFLDVLVKQASVSLCSNTAGQLLTYLMVTPPLPGSESYPLFFKEKTQILDDLYEKAEIIRAAFKQMDGMKCFGRIGALYLFPRLEKLPAGTDDFDYCMALLEETGLCTVNGSGFGQKKGTNHLRIAFLPPKEMLKEVLPQWIAFHNKYVNRK
ncbi:aminotransferase class I/II-fold pyridoxal phosphate-dependent enzyme [candidate division KSB1 bacterium]|nr:aminotransferase class I/II-fold pyridoxal phosphate-dependent enzyme [candidate division KSB1 bacterium]